MQHNPKPLWQILFYLGPYDLSLTITRANKIGKSVSSFQVQNNVKHYLKKSGKEICMLCFALEVPIIGFEHCVVWVHNQEKSDYYNEIEM